MEAFWQDLRYAVRAIARAPFLSFAVLLALSAGVGLNAAVFAVVEDSWFRPPVQKDPASFIQAIPSYSGWFDTEKQFRAFTVKDYEAMRARAKSLQEVAAFARGGAQLEDDSAPAELWLVTCNFLNVYGWGSPVKGRLFLPEECATPGSAPVAVISEGLWQNHYAGDPHIVGKIVRINQHPYSVVGVIDAPAPVWMRGDLWVPYTMQPEFWGGYDGFKQHPDYPWLQVAGRLKAGYSRGDAQAELRLIQSQQDRMIPGRKTMLQVTNGSLAEDPQDRLLAFVVIPLIMGPMLLLLLVACTNVTVLLLSRAASRRSEIAIRLTLGAGHGRLLRMLGTEGLVVASVAGAISVYLARKGPGMLWAFLLQNSGYRALTPDWTVFTYLAGVTLLAGCIAGLAPARVSLKVNLLASLQGQMATSTTRSRARNTLVVVQMAVSFVLVVAGVFFARLQHLVSSADPGFETRQVLVVPLSTPEPRYTQESAASFYRTVRERVRELPGVRGASYADAIPFTEPSKAEIRLSGEGKGQGQRVELEQVSTDFFSTLGIAIVRGRPFQDSDATEKGSAAVAVVSQTFAANFWKGQNPLGKVVLLPDNSGVLVVGVARDVASSEFDVPDGPRLYIPQSPRAFTGSLLVRFDGDARSLAPVIEQTIRDLDPAQTFIPITLRSMVDMKVEQLRPLTDVILLVAFLTIVLATSGVYGTVAFSMSQRTREFGVRMALGATQGRILASILASGVRQIAIGLSCGVLLAVPAAFGFHHLLRSASVYDWRTYCVAALALTFASLCAYYIPARRATRVDPMVALRYE